MGDPLSSWLLPRARGFCRGPFAAPLFLLRRGCEASFFSGVLCVLSGGRLPEAIHGFSIGFPGCEAKARPGCFSCIHPSPTWLGGRSFISGIIIIHWQRSGYELGKSASRFTLSVVFTCLHPFSRRGHFAVRAYRMSERCHYPKKR